MEKEDHDDDDDDEEAGDNDDEERPEAVIDEKGEEEEEETSEEEEEEDDLITLGSAVSMDEEAGDVFEDHEVEEEPDFSFIPQRPDGVSTGPGEQHTDWSRPALKKPIDPKTDRISKDRTFYVSCTLAGLGH
eukprot:GEZU01003679.1.p1 GENE.GEZU01003679.1~~GEZU01003679.1.p1  ORF type:complete len:145 (+),score=46.76 GEZU01003679.1:42-437(+)